MGVTVLAAPPAAPRVEGAWARPTPPGVDIGAGYFTVANPAATADALLRVDCAIASRTEMHESVIDAGGMMRMRALTRVDLAPGQTVSFAPGGKHLMFFGLREPLTAGTTVTLTLHFAAAAPQTVTMTVAAKAPEP